METENTLNEIPIDSTIEQVAKALQGIIAQIKQEGETPSLKARMNFLYGRFKFLEGEYDKAYTLFGNYSAFTIDNGLPENFELGYWVGRISEAKDDYKRAKEVYEVALSRSKKHHDTILEVEINKAIDRINKAMN